MLSALLAFAAANIADASWLAGRWVGEGLGGRVEETWAPAADMPRTQTKSEPATTRELSKATSVMSSEPSPRRRRPPAASLS